MFVPKYSNSRSASYCNVSTEKPDPFDTSYVNAPSYYWNSTDNQQTFSSLSSRIIDTNSVEENSNELYENVHSLSSIPDALDSDFSAELKKKLKYEKNVIPALKPFLPQQSCQVSITTLKNFPHQIPSTLSESTVSPVQVSHPAIALAKADNVLIDLQRQQLKHPLGICLPSSVERSSNTKLSAIDLELPETAESRYSTDLEETDTLFTRMGISNKSSLLQNNIYRDTNCKYKKTPMHTELMGILSRASGNQTGSSFIFDNDRAKKNEIQDTRSNCSNTTLPPTKGRNPINVDPTIHYNTRSSVIDDDIYDDPYHPVVLINKTNVTSLVSHTNAGDDVNISNYSTIDESIRNDDHSFNLYDSVPDYDICDEIRVTTNICADNNVTNFMNSRQHEQSTCKNIYDSVTGDYHQCTSYYDAVEDDSLSSASLTAPLNPVSIDLS